MLLYSNCLWIVVPAIFLQSVTKFQNQFATAYVIDENDDVILDAKKEDSNNDILDKLENNDEKSADNMPWHKRGWDKNFAVWGKRRWDNFHSWGKRKEDSSDFIIAQTSPDKKQWSKFTSWGKRDGTTTEAEQTNMEKRKQEVLQEPLVVDEQNWLGPDVTDSNGGIKSVVKRSWPQQKPLLIGQLDKDNDKREWRGFTSWGKRDQYPELDGNVDSIDKRKWAKFTSWGKRDDTEDMNDVDKRKWAKFTSWGKRSDQDADLEAEKRKWAEFTSWGKRDYVLDSDVSDDIDKKWSPLPVWGKRDTYENDIQYADKRNWSKFASWGKRPGFIPSWAALNSWGKRRWSGLRTWGKRSVNNPKAEYLAKRLLQMFDADGDGALDFEELSYYIEVLMSLPSKKVTPSSDVTQPEED